MASRVAYPGTAVAGVLSVANVNNLPGGWIGYAQITADSATFSTTVTDIAGLSQAVTVNASRRIKITLSASVNTDTLDACDFFIREGSTALRGVRFVWGNTSASSYVHFHVVLTPTAGSHTYKISGSTANVGTDVKILAGTDNPASILIEDIGPA